LNTLRDRLTIHLVTADTHNRQDEIDRILGMRAIRIQPGEEAEQKAEYIRKLGADQVVSIGQGANDELMLKESRLGICVLSREGATTTTLLSADLIVPDILSALELIEKPLRLIATLRK
jgi:soluble P-type ATPase